MVQELDKSFRTLLIEETGILIINYILKSHP
jgi:hypothetical protein